MAVIPDNARGRAENMTEVEETMETNREKDIQYEKCVVCGEMTNIPIDMPISKRKCYMSGAGQLCESCCIKIYHTDDLRYME